MELLSIKEKEALKGQSQRQKMGSIEEKEIIKKITSKSMGKFLNFKAILFMLSVFLGAQIENNSSIPP